MLPPCARGLTIYFLRRLQIVRDVKRTKDDAKGVAGAWTARRYLISAMHASGVDSFMDGGRPMVSL
jgi:hypothetical protein